MEPVFALKKPAINFIVKDEVCTNMRRCLSGFLYDSICISENIIADTITE